MNKQNLNKLLKDGKLYEKEDCIKKKSDVWDKFSMIHFKDSDVYTDYVKCKICSSYPKHHKANSEASNLRLYLKTCRSTNKDATCSTFFAEQSSITKYFSCQSDPPRNAIK